MPLRFRRPFRRLVSTRSSLRTGCLLTILSLIGGWLIFTYSGALPPIGLLIAQPASPVSTQPSEAGLPPSQVNGSEPPAAPIEAAAPIQTAAAPSNATAASPDVLPLDPPASTASGNRQSVPTSPTPAALPTDALDLLRGSQSVPVSDLLFIAGNQLLQWQRRSLQVRVLTQSPEFFVTNRDGSVILTLHAHEDAGGTAGLLRYDLRRIDPAAGTQTVILENIPYPQLFTITQQGERAAFVLEGDRTLIYTLELQPGAQAPPAAATSPAASASPTATLTSIPLPTPEETGGASLDNPASPIGACEALPGERCGALAWSSDGRSLAWSDGRGIWLADAVAHTSAQIHDLRVQVADPKGQISEYDALFDDFVWSPDGRFILLRVTRKASTATWRSVLDVRSKKMASAADSFAIEESESHVAWLGSDRIIVAHGSDLIRGEPPFIHIWNVFYTNPQLLVSDRQYNLYSDEFPFSTQSSKSIPAHQIDWLSTQVPGKILFGVKLPGTPAEPVLFTLDLTTSMISKVQTLPLETDQVTYALDGSGALVGGPNGYVFAPLKNTGLIDLSRVFSQSIRQMQWLAPSMPRKP